MYEANVLDQSTVEVTITRKIAVGQHLHIKSSYGYAGILTGTVEVEEIVHPHGMNAVERRDTVDLWLDNGLEADDPGYEDYVDMLKNQPWVRYKYISVVSGAPEDEVQYLPLELFVDHTTNIL